MIGVIDLGSNTIRLVIYDTYLNKFKTIHTVHDTLKLSMYLDSLGNLSDEGIKLLEKTLVKFQRVALEYPLDSFYILATAVIRNANNQDKICQYFEKLGLYITVLSSYEEAYLGYIGVKEVYKVRNGLVIDIGGGSTEISCIKNHDFIETLSMPYGALNLSLMYENHMPNKEDIDKMNQMIHEQLIQLKKQPIDNIYGVGGTIKIIKKLTREYIRKNVDYLIINDIKKIKQVILENQEFRKKLYLEHQDRVEMLLPAIYLIEAIFNYFDAKRLYVSRTGFREGFMRTLVKKGKC